MSAGRVLFPAAALAAAVAFLRKREPPMTNTDPHPMAPDPADDMTARDQVAEMISHANGAVLAAMAAHVGFGSTDRAALAATPAGQVRVMLGTQSATASASVLEAALDRYAPGWRAAKGKPGMGAQS